MHDINGNGSYISELLLWSAIKKLGLFSIITTTLVVSTSFMIKAILVSEQL